jgi:hypothetical protein
LQIASIVALSHWLPMDTVAPAAAAKGQPGRTFALRPPSNFALAAWKQAVIGLRCARLSPELQCLLDLSLRQQKLPSLVSQVRPAEDSPRGGPPLVLCITSPLYLRKPPLRIMDAAAESGRYCCQKSAIGNHQAECSGDRGAGRSGGTIPTFRSLA